MSYFDFNSLYEQLGNTYAEVQKAVTRWRTSSETVQAGRYAFTITTLPASEGFWSSSKVLISLKPLQESTMKTALVVSNRDEVDQLLQDPVHVENILNLLALIHSADCLTLSGQQETLGALNALKWQAYEDPTTPEIFREVLRKQDISVLLQNIELLKSTFDLMNSIDPLELKEADKEVMKQLANTAHNSTTPTFVKNIVFKKISVSCSKIVNYVMEHAYGIPSKIMSQLTGERDYDVLYAQADETLEESLQKFSLNATALVNARNKVIKLFEQRRKFPDHDRTLLDAAITTYGNLIVRVLEDIHENNNSNNNESLIQKFHTYGNRISALLINELSSYTEDLATLRQDLQDFEKRIKSFGNKLLQALKFISNEHNYKLDLRENNGFLYFDCPFLNTPKTQLETNTLIIVDTHLNRPLAKKSIYDIQEKLTFLQKKLEGYLNNYKHGEIQLERPSEYTKKAAQHTVKYITELVKDYLPQLCQEAKKRLGKWEQLSIDHSVLEAFDIPSEASYGSRIPGLDMIHKTDETLYKLRSKLDKCLELSEQIRIDLNLPEITPNTHTKSAEIAR